jgi:hypothetical protein
MSAYRSLGLDPLEGLMLIAAVLMLSTVALVIYSTRVASMKLMSASVPLLLTILLAGCQTDGVSSMTPHGGYVAHVNHATRCPPVKAATNRAALGVRLLGEAQRMAVFQDRLRGLW